MIIKPSKHFEGSDLGLENAVVLAGADVSEAIQENLGEVDWISDHEGFCECPGKHLHTTRDAKKDCKLYLSPVAALSCFHSSCRVVVEETAKKLRSFIASATGTKVGLGSKLTPEQKEQTAKQRAREALRHQAATSRHRVLRDHAWKYAQILNDSPSTVDADSSGHWRKLFGLFTPEDVIWTGAVYDSGKPHHAARFRSRDEWLALTSAPAQFVCASTFKPGSFSRGNETVARRPFLVVESDELDHDTIGAVFRWMREKVNLRLRCIVDTAGKSLHGWFEFPVEAELDELKVVLPEFGCDPKMFTASQPCRLPGALRGEHYQKIIYLDAEVTK